MSIHAHANFEFEFACLAPESGTQQDGAVVMRVLLLW
jgi:hypothetical protein